MKKNILFLLLFCMCTAPIFTLEELMDDNLLAEETPGSTQDPAPTEQETTDYIENNQNGDPASSTPSDPVDSANPNNDPTSSTSTIEDRITTSDGAHSSSSLSLDLDGTTSDPQDAPPASETDTTTSKNNADEPILSTDKDAPTDVQEKTQDVAEIASSADANPSQEVADQTIEELEEKAEKSPKKNFIEIIADFFRELGEKIASWSQRSKNNQTIQEEITDNAEIEDLPSSHIEDINNNTADTKAGAIEILQTKSSYTIEELREKYYNESLQKYAITEAVNGNTEPLNKINQAYKTLYDAYFAEYDAYFAEVNLETFDIFEAQKAFGLDDNFTLDELASSTKETSELVSSRAAINAYFVGERILAESLINTAALNVEGAATNIFEVDSVRYTASEIQDRYAELKAKYDWGGTEFNDTLMRVVNEAYETLAKNLPSDEIVSNVISAADQHTISTVDAASPSGARQIADIFGLPIDYTQQDIDAIIIDRGNTYSKYYTEQYQADNEFNLAQVEIAFDQLGLDLRARSQQTVVDSADPYDDL